MGEYKLTQEIIARSVATTWDEAKLEWNLDEVYETSEPETCLCGHTPIIELCILRNRRNANAALVGNCCVKKFIGLPSDKIFEAFKRVRKDESRALNAETIEHAFSRGWINEWERKFCFSTIRKRALSGRQQNKRIEINRKIVARITAARPKHNLS
jgi:hypothetical protein